MFVPMFYIVYNPQYDDFTSQTYANGNYYTAIIFDYSNTTVQTTYSFSVSFTNNSSYALFYSTSTASGYSYTYSITNSVPSGATRLADRFYFI